MNYTITIFGRENRETYSNIYKKYSQDIAKSCLLFPFIDSCMYLVIKETHRFQMQRDILNKNSHNDLYPSTEIRPKYTSDRFSSSKSYFSIKITSNFRF